MKEYSRRPQVSLVSRAIRKLKRTHASKPEDDFSSGCAYWDGRYRRGGTSGMGSVGASRAWKWSVIDQYVDVKTKSVLDIGCGDLSFWENRSCPSYLGVDLSLTVQARNRLLRPSWNFLCANVSNSLKAQGQVVLCMDVLFHVMDDEEFQSILRNLAAWTAEFLFVYTWRRSPFEKSNTDGKYQIFRPLLTYSSLLSPLELLSEHIHDDLGSLYVFRRRSSDSE